MTDLEKMLNVKLPPAAKEAGKKALAKFLIANAASTALDKTHISDVFQKIYDWSTDANRWIAEHTIGEIPGIGKILIEMQKIGPKVNRVLETIITGKPRTKEWNDPSYYTHLDEHVNFIINQGFKKKKFAQGSCSVPEVASMQLCINPCPSAESLKSRMTQLFQLLKGVRGLSSTVYNINQVTAYTINTATLFAVYFETVKLIRCAQTYNFRNVSWPAQLVAAMGFNIDEVSTNLADYIQLALLMQRQLRITTPSTGVFREVIEAYAMQTLVDTRNAKIATLYMYNYAYLPYFPNSEPTTTVQAIQFFGPRNIKHEISDLRAIFKQVSAFSDDETFADIAADMIGAFGKSSIYELNMSFDKLNDKPLPDPKYNELALNTLKNATVLSHRTEAINFDFHDTAEVYAQVINGAISSTLPTVQSILTGDWIILQSYSGGVDALPNFDLFVRPDGSAITETPFDENEFVEEQTFFTCHKDKYSEGESLEISQLKARVYTYVHNSTSGDDTRTIAIRTNYMSLLNIWTYDDESGDRYWGHITEVSTAQSQDGDAVLMRQCQLWSLCDWMPMLRIGIYEEGASSVTANALLWDVDDIGIIGSGMPMDNTIELTTYSIYAVNMKAEGKKIDNIQDVYND